MSGEESRGPWIKDAETAVGLINDLDWGATDEDMILLRELSFVVDGERDRVRFEVSSPKEDLDE